MQIYLIGTKKNKEAQGWTTVPYAAKELHLPRQTSLLSLFKATLLAAAASKPAAVTGAARTATLLCSQNRHPIRLKWCGVRSGLVLVPGDSSFLFSHPPTGTLSK